MRLQLLAIKALKRIYLEFRLLCFDIIGKFRKSITVSTKQGVFTVFLADRAVSRELYADRQYELDLISQTMKFLRSLQKCPPMGEGTIVDIGANIGVISIGALHTGELEKAIAIEPNPQNFTLLQRNVNQNGLKDRVICLPYAVSDRKGDVLFELSDTNFGDHRVRKTPDLIISSDAERFQESERRVITVQSDTVDNLLLNLPETVTRSIALIWIDVQGYDGYVFMGARNLLLKGIPVNAEIWPYGIRRAGMSQKQYCEIAKSIWSHYWVMRRGRFVRYPINMLDIFFDELGYDGDFENVIFI